MLKAEMSDTSDSGEEFNDEKVPPSRQDIITIYEDVKVYDYAHKGFHKLRYLDGISNDIILESLNPDYNFESAKKAGESTGKSGSFFFFSHNKQFIIKTMFQEELDQFMFNLDDYFRHIENPTSLIARIYGVFQVQMKGIVPINFMLMANNIKCKNPKNLKVYDLKGSLVNRQVRRNGNKTQTLKDKNLLFCKKYRLNRKKLGLL